jgi:hypothetical protein
MKTKILLFFCLVVLSGCAAPKPPRCLDDGRGVYPLNGIQVTEEEVSEVNKKHSDCQEAVESDEVDK